MKIRDEFALMAAEVFLEKGYPETYEAIAKASYNFADAMIAAGKVGKKPEEPVGLPMVE